MTTPDYDTDFYAWTQAQAAALRAQESKRHCQLVACQHEHMVRKTQISLARDPYAAVGRPVISRQMSNRWLISWRYAEADSR